MGTSKRFEYIDALRGIAILGVILTHSASLVQLTGMARQLTNILGMGVQLFFVISAFTIFNSLSQSIGKEHMFRDFFIKRLFRIIPVYWFGIFLYTVVYGLDSRGWREGPELWHYPYHIFLTNVLHPLTSSSVVPGGWSISVEVLFYMIAPFIFLYINSTKRLTIFMAFALIALPLGNIMLKKYAIQTFFSDYDSRTVNNFFFRWPVSQLACFGFGLVMYRIIESKKQLQYLKSDVINKVLIVLTISLIFGSIFLPKIIQQHHVVSFLFMCLGILLSVTPWEILVNKATVYMGRISYSSYLVHFLVVNQLYLAIIKFTPQLTDNKYIFFIVLSLFSITLTIPFANLGFKYIETPSIEWGRNLIRKLNKKRESLHIRN
ncbi:acyltransferase [Pseudopedobacter sp.]|uniref:acyltransferase family protein n=1 Tax=Pseudopedobacter sp. TaxID=1936787 RepID=UPI00333E2FF2